MEKRIRRCDGRCHNAKGTKCTCWCGGAFHGANGAANREALARGELHLLEENGYVEGETKIKFQLKLPLEEDLDETKTDTARLDEIPEHAEEISVPRVSEAV